MAGARPATPAPGLPAWDGPYNSRQRRRRHSGAAGEERRSLQLEPWFERLAITVISLSTVGFIVLLTGGGTEHDATGNEPRVPAADASLPPAAPTPANRTNRTPPRPSETFCERIKLSSPRRWPSWVPPDARPTGCSTPACDFLVATGRHTIAVPDSTEAAPEFVDEYVYTSHGTSSCDDAGECPSGVRYGAVNHVTACRDCSPVYQCVGCPLPTFLAYDAQRCMWSVKRLRGEVTAETFVGQEVCDVYGKRRPGLSTREAGPKEADLQTAPDKACAGGWALPADGRPLADAEGTALMATCVKESNRAEVRKRISFAPFCTKSDHFC